MNASERRLIDRLSSRLSELGIQDEELSRILSRLTPSPQKRTTLRPRSEKREQQYRNYRPQRLRYLRTHPRCEVEGCKNFSCDIHHKAKREGARLMDERYWMAVCRECHTRIGNNPAWAYEQEYLIRVNQSTK